MNREILQIAIPNILANLSIPLLSVVDVALMGHIEGEANILAIGFGVTVFSFVYWGFGFLRMGTTGLTAQEVGKGDLDESYRLLFRGLLVAFIGGAFLLLFKNYLLHFALYLIDAGPDVNNQISIYFNTRILAAPVTLGLYVFIGWFLGKQNARIPMVVTVLVNLVNALLSYLLVTKFQMDIKGVAMGTVIAQYLGFLVSVVFFLVSFRKKLRGEAFYGIVEGNALKKFMHVNSDIIIRTLCLIFTFSFFKVASSKQGDLVGAANILLLEFTVIVAYTVDGFAYAAEAISGKYFGAKDGANLKKAIRYCFYWGLLLGFLYAIVYLIFGGSLLSLLTDQKAVIDVAMDYLVWVIVLPILSVFPFIWDGVFIGVTASKAMRNTMLFSTFVVFIPSYYLLIRYMGNHGAWLAFLLFIVARGVSQSIISKKVVYGRLASQ